MFAIEYAEIYFFGSQSRGGRGEPAQWAQVALLDGVVQGRPAVITEAAAKNALGPGVQPVGRPFAVPHNAAADGTSEGSVAAGPSHW